jgi:general secretion pathway protein I
LAASRTVEPGCAGFTLLEVLVALVVIGVVLLAAVRGAMALTNSARDVRTKLLAVLTAENRLVELRLAGAQQLMVGVNQQDCQQGGLKFICEQSIESTPNPFFRRVQVRVLNSDSGSEREYALLMTVLPSN